MTGSPICEHSRCPILLGFSILFGIDENITGPVNSVARKQLEEGLNPTADLSRPSLYPPRVKEMGTEAVAMAPRPDIRE
jgi:hypothetical protein